MSRAAHRSKAIMPSVMIVVPHVTLFAKSKVVASVFCCIFFLLSNTSDAFSPTRRHAATNKKLLSIHPSPFRGGVLYATTLRDSGDVTGTQQQDEVNGIAPAGDVEEDTNETVVQCLTEDEEKEARRDAEMMQLAIQQANSRGGERGARSPFPKPIVGAVIVTKDGRVIGRGRASYKKDAVRAAIADSGIIATPLREWCVTWPSDQRLRRDITESTLYVTLEPSTERQG